MAKSLGKEHFGVDKIQVVSDYSVRVWRKHYYLTESGKEVLIDNGMFEILTPDSDFTLEHCEDNFWIGDPDVLEVCQYQFDEETRAEWKAMTDEERYLISNDY